MNNIKNSCARKLNTTLHLAADAQGMRVCVVITEGTTADCTQAGRLIEGLTVEWLCADKELGEQTMLAFNRSNKIELPALLIFNNNRY
jgi:hypothetical protein